MEWVNHWSFDLVDVLVTGFLVYYYVKNEWSK